MPGCDTVVAKVGDRPSASVINNHEALLQALMAMKILPDGEGNFVLTEECCTFTLNNAGGTTRLWVNDNGNLKHITV